MVAEASDAITLYVYGLMESDMDVGAPRAALLL